MFSWIQQQPIVVEVLNQPTATKDISIDFVLAMFKMAGFAILFAAVGGLLVGGAFILIRRLRDNWAPSTPTDPGHAKLRI